MKNKLRRGSPLVAKDECLMSETGAPALIVGKVYHIVEISESELYIKSEVGDPHSFDLYEESPSYYGLYFYLPGE